MISLGETSVLVENESHHCDRIQKGSSYISMRIQVFFPLARSESRQKQGNNLTRRMILELNFHIDASLEISRPFAGFRIFRKGSSFSIILSM